MRITVLTHADDNLWELMKLTVPNKLEYCLKNKYQLHMNKLVGFKQEPIERNMQMLDVLSSCDWMFFMDCDSIITNMKIRLEDIINNNKDSQLIIGVDVNGINNGIMLVKNCYEVKIMFYKVMNDLHLYPYDQTAMEEYFYKNNELKVAKIKQEIFNSFPYWLYGYKDKDDKLRTEGQWEKGHFILHAPAMTMNDRIKLFKEKLEEVIK